METINEKPAFRESAQRRYLILADGFYEWQWRDSKGKKKQKFLLHLPDNEPFGFAGIWGEWKDRNTGEILHTYSILTTKATNLMAEIHNHKQRMPVILAREQEKEWLMGGELIM